MTGKQNSTANHLFLIYIYTDHWRNSKTDFQSIFNDLLHTTGNEHGHSSVISSKSHNMNHNTNKA